MSAPNQGKQEFLDMKAKSSNHCLSWQKKQTKKKQLCHGKGKLTSFFNT